MDPMRARKLQILSARKRQTRAPSAQCQGSKGLTTKVPDVVPSIMPSPNLVDKREKDLLPASGLAEVALEFRVGSMNLMIGVIARLVDSMIEPTIEATLPASSMEVPARDSTIKEAKVMGTSSLKASVGLTEVPEVVPITSHPSIEVQVKIP